MHTEVCSGAEHTAPASARATSSQGASHEAGRWAAGVLRRGSRAGDRDRLGQGTDQAGFHGVAVHDRPNHDAWDPLATLAAAATVTERVRLATTAVLLPAYDETLLARQAAVVDRVSGGRLDLGVGLGARADDYQALGRPFGGRGRRLEEQLQRLHELWAAAIDREATGGTPGPAPLQRPIRRCGSAATPTRPSAAPPGSERGALVAGSVEVLRRKTATRSRLTAHLASIILC